ncbi:MAG: hypothetical protein WAR79_15165 [Melioribacteraceae bacterium]
MELKYYRILSRILFSLCCVLLALSIFSSILILISEPNLTTRFDSNGFAYFFNLFSPSIKFATASIFFLTLWVTFKRMQQTQEQIEITLGNVQFNNFYKHKEEFINFLGKMPFFEFIKKNSSIDIYTLLPTVYFYFFNATYEKFQPNLNEQAKEEIYNFIKLVKNSSLSNKDQNLEIVKIDEIRNISKHLNRTIEPICMLNSEIELGKIRYHFMSYGGHSLNLVEERFKLLDKIFWTITLYESFLAFVGIDQAERGAFTLNYSRYKEKIGL